MTSAVFSPVSDNLDIGTEPPAMVHVNLLPCTNSYLNTFPESELFDFGWGCFGKSYSCSQFLLGAQVNPIKPVFHGLCSTDYELPAQTKGHCHVGEC